MLLLMMLKQVMSHLSPPYDRHSYRGGLNLGPLQKLLKCSTRKNCKESSWKCIDGKYDCAKCKKGFELKNGRCIRGGSETAITVDLPSVTAQVTLPGFTEATFDEAAQTAFKNAVRTAAAQAAGYSESFITVIIRRFGNTILSSGNRRRQLLGDPAGLDVVFSTTFEGALVANSFAELQALTAQSEQGAITFIATLVNNIATVFPVQTFGDAILVGDPVISSEVVEIEANFPVPAAPAPPTNVQNVGTDPIKWTGSWTAAAESRPLTYSTKCVNAGDPNGCFGTSRGVGQSQLTTLTGQVLGLTPGTAYDCFAISVLVGDNLAKCSAPVRYTTLPLLPGKPTNLQTSDITSSSWTATWTPGTVGIPQETYTLKCYTADITDCSASDPASIKSGIPRSEASGTLDNLTSSTVYNCFVVAVNGDVPVCSDMKEISTLSNVPDPTPPQSEGAVYISSTGDDANVCTEVSPCATFARAQERVGQLRSIDSDLYKIVFLPGIYSISATMSISSSYLEITSTDVSSTELQFTSAVGNHGISIGATVSDIYIHDLKLVQTTFTGVGVLITTNRSPGTGNLIITDWTKNVYIYRNEITISKYAFGMAGEGIEFVNNSITRQSGNTETLSIVLTYFLRGSNKVSGNSVYDDIATENKRLRVVYFTGSGSGAYSDLWNSRGGSFDTSYNTVETTAPNNSVQFLIQDVFNLYTNVGGDVSPDLYSTDTKLALTVQGNSIVIGTTTRFKLVIFFGSNAGAAGYSSVTISDNSGNMPIDPRGWWYCDTAPDTCPSSFEDLPVIESNNISP
jgi:hypothetical protein